MSLYQNILVIHLMHLGDLMLVTPVLRTLRCTYPAARITLLADEKLADIVCENQNVDRCLFIDKKGKDRSLFGLLRFAWRLRREKYDLVINLHRNERPSLLAALSGGSVLSAMQNRAFLCSLMPSAPTATSICTKSIRIIWRCGRRGSSVRFMMRGLRCGFLPRRRRRQHVSLLRILRPRTR